MALLYVLLAAAALSPLLALGIGSRAEDPAGWRDRAALTGRGLAFPLWRLLAALPPGRIHERHVRAQLGMPARHPERCTRPGTAREHALLKQVQARTWPEGEWADVILYRDGDSA